MLCARLAGVLIAATTLALVAACDRSNRMPPGDCSALLSLHVENAEADAKRAITAADFHLIGLYGYGIQAPGLPEGVIAPDRTKPIDCTGDEVYSPRHERLIETARDYAIRYNRVILAAAPIGPPGEGRR